MSKTASFHGEKKILLVVRISLVKIIAITVLFALYSDALFAANIKWPSSPVTIVAQDQPVRDILETFFAKNNIKAIVSKNISGVASGNWKNWSGERFFYFLSKLYNLTWYVDGSTLYVYEVNENLSKSIPVYGISYSLVISELRTRGILDKRFSVTADPEGDSIQIKGPPRFVEKINKVIKELKHISDEEMSADSEKSAEQMLKVFPLKYAWASDIEVETGNKVVTIPGVAKLLRQVLSTDQPTPAPRYTGGASPVRSLRQLNYGTDDLNRTGISESETGLIKVPYAEGGRIEADPRTNSVIVRDQKQTMHFYREAIASLDIPVGLVEIRAKIIDVSIDEAMNLGFSWQYKNSGSNGNFSTTLGSDQLTKTANSGSFDFNYTTLGVAQLEEVLTRVQMLEERGSARTFSRPAVLTIDNSSATIENRQTFYVRVSGERQVDLFEINTGTVFTVVPHVIEDENGSRIKLELAIEDGTYSQSSSVDDIPVVSKSRINTQAIVEENESIVIGGFIHDENMQDKKGIPFLSRIPLIGLLFGQTSKSHRKVERIFLITPRMIKPDLENDDLAAENYGLELIGEHELKDPVVYKETNQDLITKSKGKKVKKAKSNRATSSSSVSTQRQTLRSQIIDHKIPRFTGQTDEMETDTVNNSVNKVTAIDSDTLSTEIKPDTLANNLSTQENINPAPGETRKKRSR